MNPTLRWMFLTLALIAGHAYPNVIQQAEPKGTRHEVDAQQIGTEKLPIYIHGEVTTKKDKEEAQADAEERKIRTGVDAALVKYTLWLAAFTFLLFASTALLWWTTWRDSKRQAKETQKALAIAKESADAANRTVSTLEETAHRQLRAYLFTDAIAISDWTSGADVSINVTIGNSGQTPAYTFRWMHAVAVADFPVLAVPEPGPEQLAQLQHMGTIPPGGKFRSTISFRALTQDEILAIQQRTKAIYFHVLIKYADAFGIERTTKEGFFVGGGAGPIIGPMFAATVGNEAT